MKTNNKESSASFVGHLTELRSRLIKSFIFLLITFIFCYLFAEDIYSFLVKPYSNAVIGNNLDMLKDATVLDIASHDGRWSFAALKNGAKKVYGIEGKKELVQSSIENMKKYGIAEDKYNFVAGDIFEEIKKIPINEIDVVFCLGIFFSVKKLFLSFLIYFSIFIFSSISVLRFI